MNRKMSGIPRIAVFPSAAVENLRRKAKQLKKKTGVTHHEALDIVAREIFHLPDWHHFIEQAKANELSERALKAGLVIGIDAKDADFNLSRLIHFVPDERLVMFVHSEFEEQHPKPWSENVKDMWEAYDELVYFRCKGAVPGTLEKTVKVYEKDFFFAPLYVRLKGKVLQDAFSGEDENE